MFFKENYPLKALNTFGISAFAEYYTEAGSKAQIQKLLKTKTASSNEILVLGGGSNILFTKDYPGVVMRIMIPGIHVVRENQDFFWVKAGAGVLWHDLVASCVKANFGGIENMALIPGTVGAAPVQNIGAYGAEFQDVFEALECIEIKTGKTHYFRKEDCGFGYRRSVFKESLKGQYIITNVVLRLFKEPFVDVEYGGIKQELERMDIDEPSIQDVFDAVINIRNSKLPDTTTLGNAGSFFKNPAVDIKTFQQLKNTFPDMPGYPQEDNHVKIPSGWMIEQCGLKGKKFGEVGIHDKQALVVINLGKATGEEVAKVSDMIKSEVLKKFGIELESEVNFI